MQAPLDNNYTMSHPSLFQTPALDSEMLNNMEDAKRANPSSFWTEPASRRVMAAERATTAALYDPRDPPFTVAEKSEWIRKLDPVVPGNLTGVMPTLLYYFFFSRANIETLQKNIRYTVNKWSGYNIGDQSLTELLLVMENIFSSHAKQVDEQRASSGILLRHIRTQLATLNDLVINEAVPIIVNGVEQHVTYLKRVENPITDKMLQRPMDTRVTGTRVYRSLSDVLAIQ